jgi:hypothetical protein
MSTTTTTSAAAMAAGTCPCPCGASAPGSTAASSSVNGCSQNHRYRENHKFAEHGAIPAIHLIPCLLALAPHVKRSMAAICHRAKIE